MRHSSQNTGHHDGNVAPLLNYDEGEIDELIRQVQLFDLDDQQKSVDDSDGHGRKKRTGQREGDRSPTTSGATSGSRFKIERIGNSIINWLTK